MKVLHEVIGATVSQNKTDTPITSEGHGTVQEKARETGGIPEKSDRDRGQEIGGGTDESTGEKVATTVKESLKAGETGTEAGVEIEIEIDGEEREVQHQRVAATRL